MKITTLFFISAFILSASFAQQKWIEPKVELKFDETILKTQESSKTQSLNKILTNWVLVDTMQNSFSPALPFLTPIAYDQSSDALILIHRGSTSYAQSSGEIWYNLSTDQGTSWERVSAINSNLDLSGLYPNAAISNPNNGGISQAKGVFTWLLNNPVVYGGFGIDEPLGTGSPLASHDSVISPSVLWTSGDWSFWAGETQDGFKVARTSDFSVIEYYPVLDPSVSVICLGGAGYNGNQYLGFLGAFNDPNPANPIYSGWYPGYCKSTDNGVTWDPVTVVDFRSVLPNYDRLFDFIKNDAFVSYCGDINVDKDGYVHFILSVTDTALNNNTGVNSIVEIFETVSGWSSMIIYEGIDNNTFTTREGPAVGQMGPSGYLALDKEREQMACVWVADSPTSTLGLCDIYISWRNIYSNQWTTPINLTMSDDMNENGAHLAPQLYSDGGFSYNAFVGYFYELGNFGPNPEITFPTGFWVTNPNFTYSDVSDEGAVIKNFTLSQNYPNPFNPSTIINFAIPTASKVVLKIYDVLGREVATLLDGEKAAGNYQVNFDASKLASGIYVYTINAGSFTSSKKMMLMK